MEEVRAFIGLTCTRPPYLSQWPTTGGAEECGMWALSRTRLSRSASWRTSWHGDTVLSSLSTRPDRVATTCSVSWPEWVIGAVFARRL
jgi:hypothetical protein